MLVQEIEPRDYIFVQHAHLGARLVVHFPHVLTEASFNVLHFLAEIRAGGGKLNAHLGSEFQNLHFERVDAIRQDLQLFHFLFQNLNPPLEGF